MSRNVAIFFSFLAVSAFVDLSAQDDINVTSPGDPYLIGTNGNDLEIEWSYASPSGGSSSPQWSYNLDEDYSTGSAGSTQTGATVLGSAWLSGVSDGWHTLYVALLDEQGNGDKLSFASYTFNYQSSGSAVQSPDGIAIVLPDVTYLHSSDSNGLQVHWNYQSQDNAEQSLSWAYSLNGETYSSPVNGTKDVPGSTWLSGVPYTWNVLHVALLDQTNGAPLAYASHVFNFQSGSGGQSEHYGNPPYFLFSSNELNSFTSGVSLPEGNYTILKEHNATDSQTFELAKVYRDSNGYQVVDTTTITESSISFAELEAYLDTNNIKELGFVDFMPFDFRPIARIDLNQSTEVLSLASDFDDIFYQEFNDSTSGNTYWALSIEQDDGNESNNSSLVVDMAGFVYDGHFENYWYHSFGIAAYEPNTEPEQKHTDWNETFYGISDVNISKLYSDYPQIGRPQLFFTKTDFNMTENNDFNLTLDSLSLSLPELLGDLNYSVSSISQSELQLPLSVDQNGSIIIHNKVYYDAQSQISFNVTAFDQFDRNITDQITITVEREPLLPIVQTIGHQINSDGVYTLTGKLLSKGGVPLSSLGFLINGEGFSFNEELAVNLNTAEGAEFSVSLGTRTVDGGNTYTFTTYAENEKGLTLGAARKFTTEDKSSWTDGADDLDGGWKSHWFGIFLPQPNGWSYHLDLGWAFISPDSDGGIWFWKDGRGWNWTKEGLWPFMWSNNTTDWMYMVKGSSRVLIFDYSTDSYITDF